MISPQPLNGSFSNFKLKMSTHFLITKKKFRSIRARARIDLNFFLVIKKCVDILSLKFEKDPFSGCGEINILVTFHVAYWILVSQKVFRHYDFDFHGIFLILFAMVYFWSIKNCGTNPSGASRNFWWFSLGHVCCYRIVCWLA